MSTPTLQRLLRRPAAVAALIVLGLVVALALAAPLLPLPPAAARHPAMASQPPTISWGEWSPAERLRLSAEHPLAARVRQALFGNTCLTGLAGTDDLGRDLAARLISGARISLLVGLAATMVAMVIGVSWGLIAGLASRRIDGLMMRLVDIAYAVPFLFVVILLIAMLRGGPAASAAAAGPDRLLILFIAIGAISWLTMARVVRGQVLSLRQSEFVLAARALGASTARIAWSHMLPNLRGLIAVYLTLTVPRVMLFEAFLSYLGLGVEPPGVSWGILASQGMATLTAVGTSWWLIVFPGLALTLTLGALNLLGDSLRDAFDPRLSS